MKAIFVNKKQEIGNIYSFYFKTKKPQKYYAGQYYYFTLNGITKQFTLSSSPTEKLISITTKIHENSEFKKALSALKKGSFVDIEGPNGVLFVDQNLTGQHVFIAGGLGITPFRSMITYLKAKNINAKIKLVYSSSDGFVFRRPLPNTVLLDKRIDKQILKKHLIKDATYWVCGPPAMVTDVENMLIRLKIPQEKILSEKFSGY
ncbi:MAG: Oxidoreductase FAD-binding domain protein [Candidatus Woesebacteria bacterium GW2011_GWB1_38_5b]|uniref:Oxidoreductase FAD-binding domain protein n=1 Tax=Candidatus Woesebacteria bacterium GW2011_GWB1_38_5b TaxID=1618569 RepID=A0A0G0NFQ4_9BACT|nr:MAG: Oxidoreductase FAD-binding domain protein [Candidatus Woesebacteria bacterium GW2011_GWB1_38_5b]